MFASTEEIIRLERANYLATRQIAEQTPGLTLRIRDDLILSWIFKAGNLQPLWDIPAAESLRCCICLAG